MLGGSQCSVLPPQACGLTLRSRRGPTAGHQARATGTVYIFCGSGLASHRWSRLTSNVRRHQKPNLGVSWRFRMHIAGACHCGAVSFTAQIDPTRVMVCHCTDCQVLSGAPFRAVAVAPIETLKVQGTTKAYIKVAQSGNRRAQVFCPECATPLWATAPEDATSVVVRLGCVKQKTQLTPVVQVWQHSSLSWLQKISSIPSTPEGSGFLPVAPPSGAA